MTRTRQALNRITHRLCLAILACLAGLLCAAVCADELRVVTEELPPYNMSRDGQITGLSTEVVRAVLKEAGVQAEIQSMPWARAYDLALHSENVLIYSIMHTPQRDKLFKWVGVIAPTRWYLFSRADKPVHLATLDDARRYQIATVNEDAGEQYLVNKGFVLGRQLQSSSKYEHNYDKLRLGRVDLWVANELNAFYLARQAGEDPAQVLQAALPLPDMSPTGGLEMACSLQTPDAVVERLRKALETLKKNGSHERIQKKWL
jgi:polar amino acid transport system substrate-binding protein